MNKTQRKLLARACASPSKLVVVETGVGHGPKGGRRRWGAREAAAADALAQMGKLEFVRTVKSRDPRRRSTISMTDFVYRVRQCPPGAKRR